MYKDAKKIEEAIGAIMKNKDELHTIWREISAEYMELPAMMAPLIDPNAPPDVKVEVATLLVAFFERRIRKLEDNINNLANLIAEEI